MAGVKGLSGRKRLRDEEKRLRIIEKSWDAIEAYLDSIGGSLKDKADMASKVVAKDMPTKLEGEVKGQETKVVVMVENDTNKSKEGRLPAQVSVEPSEVSGVDSGDRHGQDAVHAD